MYHTNNNSPEEVAMRYPRPTKEEYRSVFLALHADCKRYPGGISALSEHVRVSRHTLANALNPDAVTAPPAFGVILELLTLTRGERTIFELCRLVDKIPMDIETERVPASESVRMFLELTRKASAALGAGALAAEDGRFDAAERQELEPLLRELLQATGDLIASLRSR